MQYHIPKWTWLYICLVLLTIQAAKSDLIIIGLTQNQQNLNLAVPREPLLHSKAIAPVQIKSGLTTNISLGTPKQTLTLSVDIGSFSSRVYSSECTTCKNTTQKFNNAASSTFMDLIKPNSVDFGSGRYVNGSMVFDDITIGDLSARHQIFLLIKKQTGSYAEDGRFALAPGTFDVTGFPNLVDYAYMQKKITEKTFAIWGSRTSSAAELSIGGPNSKRYTGTLKWVPLSSSLYWDIKLSKISTTIAKVMTTACSTGCSASFSTISSYIYGPTKDVDTLHVALGAKLVSGRYTFNCTKVSTLQTIDISAANSTFALPSSVYTEQIGSTCYSVILPWSLSSWTFGTPFYKGLYTVFNAQNNMIGFATPTA